MRPLPDRTTTLLCDADGTLFPSEEPAFEASATVVADVLAGAGVRTHYSAEELRRMASGRNFRNLVPALLAAQDRRVDGSALDRWVERENAVVTDHLSAVLTPDPEVRHALGVLAEDVGLALVSSSGLTRLDACLRATDLDALFPPHRRFSAQDSLPAPTSKPAPDVYLHALDALGLEPSEAVAVEDAPAGVRSAVDAGIAVVGLTAYVPPEEREDRRVELLAAGATIVLHTWATLVGLVSPSTRVPPASRRRVE